MRPKTPLLAVDIILVDSTGAVLLIERKNPPHGWALPGGFVDVGEEPRAAAIRELLEETGLRCDNLRFAGYYGAPDRDPRGHVVSLVFYGNISGMPAPAAADDAANAEWVTDWRSRELAFDHRRILEDAFGG